MEEISVYFDFSRKIRLKNPTMQMNLFAVKQSYPAKHRKNICNHSLSYLLRLIVFCKRLTPIYKFTLSLVRKDHC
jgi:hypothetical protein